MTEATEWSSGMSGPIVHCTYRGTDSFVEAPLDVDLDSFTTLLLSHINGDLSDMGEAVRSVYVAAEHGARLGARSLEEAREAVESVPGPRQRGPLPPCRSLLSVCHRLLPSHLRDDALDEWLDELETAAEAGEPVRRRTLSIVFRAVPRLAILHRLPGRVSRRG